MTDFQARTTKTTTQTENRLRNVEYSENTVRSDIQALYDQILEKRAAYDAAKTAYESGKMVWDAAQIQKQNGSLSQIQYLQQELAWLTAESGYHSGTSAGNPELQMGCSRRSCERFINTVNN